MPYFYDKLNRLVKLINHNGEIFENIYDLGSRITHMRTPASVSEFSFDNINSLSSTTHKKRSSGSTLANYSYTRDNIGNITKVTTTKGDFAFVYDNNNQLTNATHPEDITSVFMYDSLGNRISDQFGNYNYDNKRQRLIEDWKFIYTYDENGNISSKILKSDNTKVTNYTHNSQNQLIKIEEYEGINVAKETSYFYDVIGRRIQKTHTDHNVNTNSFERKFQYDGDEILTELDEDNNVKSIFTHSGLRTDDVLAVDKSGTSYFYLKDHLGTVSDIIDSSGSLVQHYVYSPFGKIIRIENKNGGDVTDAPMVDNFYTFTGREHDKESGLYYYRARYLDSETGRFIQSDPDEGNLYRPLTKINKFIYALNNPVLLIDPTGRTVVTPDTKSILDVFGVMSVVMSLPLDITKALLFQRGSFFDNLGNNMNDSKSIQGSVLTFAVVPQMTFPMKAAAFVVYAVVNINVLEARLEKAFKKILSIF